MASFNKFNAFVANLANGGMNLGSDTLKVMLTNTAPVAASNSVYTDISSNEVANGNGYTTGGLSITLTSSTQTGGLYKLLMANSATLTASGTVGPFRYAVIYDTVGSKYLIGYWDYGSSIAMSSADTFQVLTDQVNGVIQLS
jgi:hypothetical protein